MGDQDKPKLSESDECSFSDEALSGPVIDRRTTLSLLSSAGLAGLAGCAGSENSQETETTTTESNSDGEGQATDTTESTPNSDRTGGTLSVGWHIGSIDRLDPPYITDQKTFPLMANIFNGLVWLKEDLTIRGDLASDWEVTNNGKTITFQLREGVTFHNGVEFTAEDVKYTINRTISNDTPSAAKLSALKPVDEGGVVVQDDYTVQLNFEYAMAPALIYLTRGPGRAATIVNQEAIEEMGREQYTITPVGTGPFKVTKHNVGSGLTLERFEDYFKTDENGTQLPYLDTIEINPIPEPATLVNAVRSGDVDFVDAVPLQNVGDIEKANNVQKIVTPGLHWEGLGLNNVRDPFTSKKVRLAIAKLINNKAFVESAFFGNALPDTGPLNKGTKWVWREDKPNDQDYAPEEGQQMLQEEGADSASFNIMTTAGGLRAAKVIRQQLNQSGLNVGIDQVTSSTFSERLDNNDFDATMIGTGGDPDPDQSLYNLFRLPDKDGLWNYMQYKSQEVHDLLGKQRRQLDREERKTTLHKIEDRLIADAPFAFLYHEDDIAARQSYVKGYVPISGLRYFDTVWLDQ